MRANKLWRTIRHCHHFKTSRPASPLASSLAFRVACVAAMRLCGGASTDRPSLKRPADESVASYASPRVEYWDDKAVVDEIRLVLQSALLKTPTENSIPVHELFRALSENLRGHLQRSSFASLIVALKSRPDWFAITTSGLTRVGLTESARSVSARSSRPTTATVVKSVLVRGATVSSTALDVSRPPLTAEEVENWRLTRVLLPLTLPFLMDKEPVTFFSYHEKPRRLSPEFVETDELYSVKGFFPPSEVAAVFVHITPTYFVETRHVLYAMPPDVAQILEKNFSKERIVEGFFKKYPMIFKLKTGKFQKTVIKLNLDFPFIRNYPGCGHADRMLRRHNQEFRPSVGGVVSRTVQTTSPTAAPLSSDTQPMSQPPVEGRRPEPHIDIKIFEILLRNLPRVASDPSVPKEDLEMRRHQILPLVDWINGFPKNDIDVLNSVPQQRVLTILTRYLRIFQLLCHGEDGKLFSLHQDLEGARATRPYPSMKNECDRRAADAGTAASSAGDATQREEEDYEKDEEYPVELTTTEMDSRRREATLREALRDDMIGLDSILDPCTVAQVKDPSDEVPMADEHNVSDESNNKYEIMEETKDDVDMTDANDDAYDDDDDVESLNRNSISAPAGRAGKEGYAEDDPNGPYIPSSYDILYVRRIPKHIAPRSLSDYNFTNTPEPELVKCIASLLNSPPSLRDKLFVTRATESSLRFGSGSSGPWRWVPVQRIYASLSSEQRRAMRPYKGLVHFIRLHGELFALSADFMHVIAHDPQGAIPPFVPTQTVFYSEDRVILPPNFDNDEGTKASLIGDADRPTFGCILGSSQIPTDRQQLLLLDPLNPVLDHDILCEEVSFFLPDHPVTMHQLMGRLPPILRAAVSSRRKNTFLSSKHITAWSSDGRIMLQKSKLPPPDSASTVVDETMSMEDAIECVRETIPNEGVVIMHLSRMLPPVARRTFREHFGNLYNALLGYPQYFYVEKNVETGDKYGGIVYLVEHLQEKK